MTRPSHFDMPAPAKPSTTEPEPEPQPQPERPAQALERQQVYAPAAPASISYSYNQAQAHAYANYNSYGNYNTYGSYNAYGNYYQGAPQQAWQNGYGAGWQQYGWPQYRWPQYGWPVNQQQWPSIPQQLPRSQHAAYSTHQDRKVDHPKQSNKGLKQSFPSRALDADSRMTATAIAFVPESYNVKSTAEDRAASTTAIEDSGTLAQARKYAKRHADPKIPMPAPHPTAQYLTQAAQAPTVASSANAVLVVLDLNGTLLHRRRKGSSSFTPRPFLDEFLEYLFENFSVMVWSSATPPNVNAMVQKALNNDQRSRLLDICARNTFGLTAANYARNVQVYKDLCLLWGRNGIQEQHPGHKTGQRWDQSNTILIDDTSLKASAQPHNLLEISEFEATPEQMKGDVLKQVAGYLEVAKTYSDVSSFIKQTPFKAGGSWTYDWRYVPIEDEDDDEEGLDSKIAQLTVK
ncbi:HAD-like protein [Polyplosphaeria fusca]|uniref:Mitochondrial import inner membrane translocase subunit TIM50 n=1 Tax=Polyplosphaeria fusca TaxID=682080 RepID=A0A9P4UZS2_9PLEO|nr:HAD-like protein [Polyplosphaeria fusca]